jgi:hypothetical protein
MVTLEGIITAFEESLLFSVTVTFPAGAGLERTIGNDVLWPRPTLAFDGIVIDPNIETVTVAVVSARFGSELAWIVALPIASPLTGINRVVAFTGNDTTEGTVATFVSDEDRLMDKPAGAGLDKASVRLPEPPVPTVRVGGLKLIVPETATPWLSPSNPGEEAVTVTEP